MRLALDLNRMDVLNFTETWGYGLLFFAEANVLGLTVVPVADTPEKKNVVDLSKRWLSKVEPALPMMRPGEAFQMLTMYDFLHRIVCHSPMAESLSNEYVLRAFKAMKAGDESVCRYSLFGAISSIIVRNGDKRFLADPKAWQADEINRWLDNFSDEEKYDKLPIYDRLQQAVAMLRTDLSRFGITCGDVVKSSVRRENRHLISDLIGQDVKKYDFRTYYSLDQLLSECRDEFNLKAFRKYKADIQAAMISSPDIDVYTRVYYKDYLSRYMKTTILDGVAQA